MPAAPAEGVLPIDNCQQLLTNALTDAGVIGIDEPVEQPMLNRAFTQANWLLAQWARKRWLCYRLVDYSFVSTGAETYTVGLNQNFNISPRPDRVEYAFLRILNGAQAPNTPVDIPLDIITAHEDYARIVVKKLGTFTWAVFYDPEWPIGILRPWPIAQATNYEIHLGFKVVLPRFTSLQMKLNFPPEYEAAMNWCLVRRFRATYQMPADPAIDSLARDGLNAIRLGNTAVPNLHMPAFLRNRRRAYSYQSDTP